ncbi:MULTISPECIES: NAD(+)/NADH kinase [Acidithiobacillus]|jgi:NAD+ kinase|uniref:NAD kinase n=1 Tax=Acidithiobacillus thiooxidans ATCC 19377 TaxID=637390 RepID=A0A5P9XMM1_ACITH|nr:MULTISPECIES: NAD(+)/NADH kinase [Acidithiobacillus]MBU2740547.1 NAD kinase [Acidithiobacillus albertensis]MBU2835513.1 NAD kinase [Acidithiobacillus thiooxidans]QFX95048.1 inorganic polyphosphate kinase [Acidithiobacillus thiooxidans ATCC 19377]
MTKPFQRVLLVSKYRDPSVLPGLRLLRDFIQSQGREVFIETQCSGEINDTLGLKLMAFSEARAETDLVIAIGGDGTLLGTARNTASSGIAILGINQGRLGFLADLSIDQIEGALPPILQGHYQQDQRRVLHAELWRDNQQIHSGLAINEVFIHKGGGESMIELSVHMDGRFVYTQRADGVIIATPTGSTAYALSAGGPILSPSLAALLLVPICPHTLTARPLVVADTVAIRARLTASRQPAALSLDSHSSVPLAVGDEIHIRRAPCSARFIHPEEKNFFQILREKLHWAESPGED